MPNVQLYINDQLCDLTGDEEISVDYSIFDLSKIGARGGARSYEFEIPKTSRNKAVLENSEIINNLSSVPYTRLKALVLVDGVDVLIRFCELQSVKDFYRVRVYGANSDIFSALNKLKLSDLDFSDYGHVWNLESIENVITATQGYIYPVIDYCEDSPNAYINNDNRVMRGDFMLPALFVNTLLELIFSAAGLELDNQIEAETENLIVPVYKPPVSDLTGLKYNGIFNTTSDIILNQHFPNGIRVFNVNTVNTYSGGYYSLPYPVTYNYAGNISNGFGLYIDDTVDLKVRFRLSISNPNAYPVTLTLRVGNTNGSTNGNQIFLLTVSVVPGLSDIVVEADVLHTMVDNNGVPVINPSYYFFFYFYQTTTQPAVTIKAGSTIEIYDTVIVKKKPIYYEQFMPFAELVPDMTQATFLKNYMQMFGLLPTVSNLSKKITLTTFDKILANVQNAYNWSDKIDTSESAEVIFILDDYGQKNTFEYEKDGEEEIPIGTNGSIEINNKNLVLEKEAVKLDFSSTNAYPRLMDNNVAQIGVFSQGEYKNEKKPRILNIKRKSLGGALTITDGTDSIIVYGNVPVPYFIDANETFNLGFENSLLPTYYELLSNVLNRIKVVTVPVRLTASDISQLDFTRPVFIKQFESYFYISKVVGFSYTSSESTLVELVKLNII